MWLKLSRTEKSQTGESLVSRAVDRLARTHDNAGTGLVRIVKHPEDRRRRFVYLTDKGQDLRDELAEMLSG